ncbi:hypothetical protein PRIPAC_74367, partial [Pristionchus pacificus]
IYSYSCLVGISMDRGRLLEHLSSLARRLITSNAINNELGEITRILQGVTPRSLNLTLPSSSSLLQNGAPILYSAIAESPSMHCSMFGFRTRNDVIPMHDHPTMHGFIRVLRGSLRITSFSLLPTSTLDTPEVRFNGERDVSERDGCIYLSPQMDNIHQVRSLEDGTFFFDLLIPGYKEVDCTYFQLPNPLPAVGTEMELQRCSTPSSYSCLHLPYDTQYYEE